MIMEPQRPITQPEQKPIAPAVMDIVPPRSSIAEPLKAAPPDTASAPTAQPEKISKRDAKQQKEKTTVTKAPKTPGNGTGLAVAATIIIVLGLGAMMVYAYFRTKGISIF
jgi:hypothetical protein